jgi:hypothetical protein
LLAVGSICLLLGAPIQAAGYIGANGIDQSGGSRSVAASNGHANFVALSADVQITGQSGSSTDHLYRDSHGRTRYESGSTVTINDPATRTTLLLDTSNQTYRRVSHDPTDASQRAADVVTSGKLASEPRALGTAQVNGVSAEGRAYTVTVPASKVLAASQKEVTLWLSVEVALPVELRIVDSSGLAYAQSYTNIRTGVQPAAHLFTVPAGYREVDAAGTGAGINEACPLFNAPDPLVLNSFGPFLDGGFVDAVTDPQVGCIFAADGAVFEYPLSGFPTVPLGLPFDEWFAFDTGGGGLPFLPWVAFGDIAFLAWNGTDTTTKDSLVVLTVWCC